MGFNLDLIIRVPNPFLSDVNLLGNLHISNTESHKECISTQISTHLNVQRRGLLTNLPTLRVSLVQLFEVGLFEKVEFSKNA